MALMQWMLQLVPQAPVPTAVQAATAEPVHTRPGPQEGVALQQVALAAGLSGRPELVGREGSPQGPGLRDGGRGGPAAGATAAGVPVAFTGLGTQKAVAVAVAVATPAAALSSDSARALSRPEPGASSALPGLSASTADIQALLPSAAHMAAVSAASTVAMPAGNPVSAPAQTWIQTPVTQPGFSNEVVVALVRDVSQAEQGTHTLTLHLNPEELGPVSVSIEVQGNAARIEFSASEVLTRHHLEAALPELSQALQDQGVSLTQGGVHEASKESLAASAAGSQSSGSTGSEGRQRGDSPFDGRPGYGERAPRRDTEVFSLDGRAMSDPGARASNGPSPGRAGRLDLFA